MDALRPVTDKVLDCHLMIVDELRVADFAKAGADIVSVHADPGTSTIHLHRTVNQIKDLGCKAGVVLNPGTPRVLEYVIEEVDLILVMSVNPGFGGQSFIESQVDKIKKIKAMCDAKGVNPWIEVDGGVSHQRVQGDRGWRQRPRRRLCRVQLARLRRSHRRHQGVQGAQVNDVITKSVLHRVAMKA